LKDGLFICVPTKKSSPFEEIPEFLVPPFYFPPRGEKSSLFYCNCNKYQRIIAPLGEMSSASRRMTEGFRYHTPHPGKTAGEDSYIIYGIAISAFLKFSFKKITFLRYLFEIFSKFG